MTRAHVLRSAVAALALTAGLVAVPRAHAGSTEPELAIARAVATVDAGTVTLEVRGNYDYGNVVRLGYPVTIVVTSGNTVARLALDGTVTVAIGGGTPAPVAGAPGVIAIAPDQLTAVLPPVLAGAGAASVQLEAAYGHDPLRSNRVGVTW